MCDLFAGLKGLFECNRCGKSGCGACEPACDACEPAFAACEPACEPACKPKLRLLSKSCKPACGEEPACDACDACDPCGKKRCSRPLLDLIDDLFSCKSCKGGCGKASCGEEVSCGCGGGEFIGPTEAPGGIEEAAPLPKPPAADASIQRPRVIYQASVVRR
ncbi:MAG TPA: hypothetical protein VMY42_17540 [Thermoguttaceae bacterium]|nr:hypothetical protein [Thermoguttaceae bacterium]